MTAISPISVSELKERVSLKALFERDNHDLKKAGADTWRCRCPFHVERTASCVVHDEKGFFKCFGCNARGTIIEYWALARGLDKDSQFLEICHQLGELVLGHAVPPPQKCAMPEIREPERPAPLSGRDLERWEDGCRFLALHPAEQEKIAAWRGYRVETVRALAEQGKMGIPIYFGERLPAFSVECVDEAGESYLAGWHVRLEPRAGEKHAVWHFVPRGIGSWPFVIGNPRSCACLVILEGQWDALAFIDALDQGLPLKNVAVMGVRGSGAWEKVFVWNWNHDQAQAWLFADGDDAGMTWLHAEQGFAWHLRRRCKALHACAWEGVKDFNDAHRGACVKDRAEWTRGLRAMMRRQFMAGKRTRKYRPKRERVK
ncbi:MAG: primase [Chthoniobacter sp.]|jgi:hypothetical protein|nr:primase [Chthoniobacter sp.]